MQLQQVLLFKQALWFGRWFDQDDGIPSSCVLDTDSPLLLTLSHENWLPSGNLFIPINRFLVIPNKEVTVILIGQLKHSKPTTNDGNDEKRYQASGEYAYGPVYK